MKVEYGTIFNYFESTLLHTQHYKLFIETSVDVLQAFTNGSGRNFLYNSIGLSAYVKISEPMSFFKMFT